MIRMEWYVIINCNFDELFLIFWELFDRYVMVIKLNLNLKCEYIRFYYYYFEDN